MDFNHRFMKYRYDNETFDSDDISSDDINIVSGDGSQGGGDLLKEHILQPLRKELRNCINSCDNLKNYYDEKGGRKSALFIAVGWGRSRTLRLLERSKCLDAFFCDYCTGLKFKKYYKPGKTMHERLGFGSKNINDNVVALQRSANRNTTRPSARGSTCSRQGLQLTLRQLRGSRKNAYHC